MARRASPWPASATPTAPAPLALALGLDVVGRARSRSPPRSGCSCCSRSRFVAAARSGSWLTARLAPHLGPCAGARSSRDTCEAARVHARRARRDGARVRERQAVPRAAAAAHARRPPAARLGAALCVPRQRASFVGIFARSSSAARAAVLLLDRVRDGAADRVGERQGTAPHAAFDNQLPDILITVAASLKAGHSFRHAIQAVVDEGAEPAAKEFRRVLSRDPARPARWTARSPTMARPDRLEEPQLRAHLGDDPAAGRRLARRALRHGRGDGAPAAAVRPQGARA